MMYNFQLLQDMMSKQLLMLREFTWVDMTYSEFHDSLNPFGSFAGFKRLKKLNVDYDLIFGTAYMDETNPELPDPTILTGMLPSCL